jgi:hypothetical protein
VAEEGFLPGSTILRRATASGVQIFISDAIVAVKASRRASAVEIEPLPDEPVAML